jgi:2-dehydropantoate 2-reductase
MPNPKSIAVVGLGSIGGWAAARLAQAGHRVSAVARGQTLAAVKAQGLLYSDAEGEHQIAIAADDDATKLGPQDIVIVAVKGPALAAASASVAPLIGPHTVVIPMMNGVPWWFLADRDPEPLRSIDPVGEIARNIPTDRVIGCVVHASCASPSPGRIVHKNSNGLIFGEPNGRAGDRLAMVADLFRSAGFAVTESDRIQYDIWYKLWGNMTMNPISAITGAPCDKILDDALVRGFIQQVMAEAAAVGAKIGCAISENGEDRNAVTRKLGAFKTSMLQDVEAGRQVEIDALVAAPREIARRVGVPTPALDALLGLSRLFAQTHGLYPA